MPRIVPVHYRKLVRVFEKLGFVLDRQEGDHLIYIKKSVRRPIVIPMYRTIQVFIILNNLKTAGISRQEYLKLLL
ncbi:MAG: type II toxin-antitoxin system HicA family toxin [Patescibacteria group bacterium]